MIKLHRDLTIQLTFLIVTGGRASKLGCLCNLVISISYLNALYKLTKSIST